MRTIRLLAVAAPLPGMKGVCAPQPEMVYAVAIDETFWAGTWDSGKFEWRELPSIPQRAPTQPIP